MKNIKEAGFLKEMCDITANMYRLGWDERNGGNVSLLLDDVLILVSLKHQSSLQLK